MTANFLLRRIVATNDKGESQLFIQIEIDCDACGMTEGTIHGHHLRTLHKALGMVIAEQPDLCGVPGDVQQEIRFAGQGADPKKARLN